MIEFENNPMKEVIDAIETVTQIDATLVFLDAETAGKEAAYGAEDNGVIYICLNVGVPFGKMLQAMALVAAGYAAEKTENVNQQEVFEKITAELVRREAAKNE